MTNALILMPDTGNAVVVECSGGQPSGSRLVTLIEEVAAGKPVTHVIQTHHHMDHSSGVRQVLGSTGADLVVGHGVKEFWENTLQATSNIRPDALTGKTYEGEVLELAELGSLAVVDTDAMKVTVYHTDSDPHAEDAVIIEIVADDKVFVYTADMYNAGNGLTVVVDGPAGLFSSLMKHKILDCACESVSGKPVTIVPGHGTPTSVADAITELDGLGVATGCQPASCKMDDMDDVTTGSVEEDDDTSGAMLPSNLGGPIVVVATAIMVSLL